VVVVALVDGVGLEPLSVELEPLLVEPGPPMAPLLVEPGPPMEVVLPDVSPLGVPGVVLPPAALVLPGVPLVLLEVDVSLPGAGLVVVVDELDEDVVGVPV
jgi:hypothetical protein